MREYYAVVAQLRVQSKHLFTVGANERTDMLADARHFGRRRGETLDAQGEIVDGGKYGDFRVTR